MGTNATGLLHNIYKYTTPLVRQSSLTIIQWLFKGMSMITEKECDTNMNSECRYFTHFIDWLGLLKFIICSKTGNLSISENLGYVSVGYSEDRNLETAVTVA